jgi:hypothetical protein
LWLASIMTIWVRTLIDLQESRKLAMSPTGAVPE